MIKDRHEAHMRAPEFFSRAAMRFFNSRIGKFYPVADGAYFVTSERFDADTPRLYSVRFITDAGETKTMGKFQQHATARAANNMAARFQEFHRVGTVAP